MTIAATRPWRRLCRTSAKAIRSRRDATCAWPTTGAASGRCSICCCAPGRISDPRSTVAGGCPAEASKTERPKPWRAAVSDSATCRLWSPWSLRAVPTWATSRRPSRIRSICCTPPLRRWRCARGRSRSRRAGCRALSRSRCSSSAWRRTWWRPPTSRAPPTAGTRVPSPAPACWVGCCSSASAGAWRVRASGAAFASPRTWRTGTA